ncbi:protoporphyrinogen oxidase [uncultured Trichococcus sp.]|uniref:protoporphyrinogen oxidase n=1 Tax=uncultured Trichococcus sp. TaxID=189665 RepID=UPI0029C63EE3|nr:protoporphyrinogen oxidase [uncultured Trichococcus sp.]
MKRRIAIIGGGLRGLTAAYEIDKAIREQNLPFEYVVLEERASVGGMIHTIDMDGYAIDVGASAFDSRRADISGFLQELGLENEKQSSRGGKLVLFDGNAVIDDVMPTYHGMPLFPNDIWQANGLTLDAKLRAFMNSIFLSNSLHENPEYSTDNFLELRLGREVVDYMAEPYYPDNVYGSMELMPVKLFDENLVTIYGKAHIGKRNKEQLMRFADGSGQEYTFKGGLATLTKRLAQHSEGHLYVNQKVKSLNSVSEDLLLIELNGRESMRAGCVVVTTNPQESLVFLDGLPGEVAIPKAHSTSVGTVFFKINKTSVKNLPEGQGFVIPRRSSFHSAKVVVLNNKWPLLEQAEYYYVLVEFGRRLEETLIELADDLVMDIIKNEVKEILALTEEPLQVTFYRWEKAVPHFSLQQRQEMLDEGYPVNKEYAKRGIFVGGNGIAGYGMENAIIEGKRLADEAIRFMKKMEENDTPNA